MEPITVHTGTAVPLRRSNVDTDQIIPAEYLKRITRTGYEDALFVEWRLPGCSMCLGMNPDTLAPGERSASTSNRNFEGRQGKGGRTHLVSVPVAAATAIRGTLSSPADLEPTLQEV